MDHAALICHLDRTLADLKDQRLCREAEWQQIADYFDPTKDFTIRQRPGELRRRRLTSAVPGLARARCAAILTGYLIDPSQPFIMPNVERGLVAAGRPTGLDDASNDYLSTVAWQVFGRMLQTRAGFMNSTSHVCDELVGFGTGIQWIGRKRGFGPRYQARPLRSCWIAENDDGEVDTLYYEFTLPLWRAKKRFPNAAYVDGWDTDDESRNRQLVTIVHVVEPRDGGGTAGFDKLRKPFAEYYVTLEKKALLEEGGYDSFPFAVPRLNKVEGSAYGRGLCWAVLPDAIVLSNIQHAVERGVDLRINPPLLVPSRMFGKPLDQRAGAVNGYDAAGLGFQSAREAIQKLDLAGDVNVGVEYQRMLMQTIEQGLFTDWMRLRDSGDMTAEEVRERRELRLRSMSAFIPGVDRDLMGVAADRTLEIMVAEGQLPAPPEALAGMNVDWDYSGPLARAQQQQQAEAMERLFNIALVAGKLDPSSVYVLEVAEGLRAIAESYGAPVGVTRSRQAIAQHRAAEAERQDTADSLAATQQGATSLRDAAQGINSLTQAANGGDPAQAAAA